jgi:SAM-dependent methyltransferase
VHRNAPAAAPRPSLPPAHFDALYRARPDPWNLADSDYEAAKYAATIAALGGRRFAAGFEAGCAIGVLTRRLAAHCDALLAADCAADALAAAAARLVDQPHVRLARLVLPGDWPDEQFDLIVLSEILYFWDAHDIARAAARVDATLRPGGMVLAVSWLGPNDGTMPGACAAALLRASLPPDFAQSEVGADTRYRIDRAVRPG